MDWLFVRSPSLERREQGERERELTPSAAMAASLRITLCFRRPCDASDAAETRRCSWRAEERPKLPAIVTLRRRTPGPRSSFEWRLEELLLGRDALRAEVRSAASPVTTSPSCAVVSRCWSSWRAAGDRSSSSSSSSCLFCSSASSDARRAWLYTTGKPLCAQLLRMSTMRRTLHTSGSTTTLSSK